MEQGRNHHGTLISLNGQGVFITGPSGSGKTTLALTMLSRCTAIGIPAMLVSDDQIIVKQDAILIGYAPHSISGLVEVRGFGPVPIDNKISSPIHLIVQLVRKDLAPRLYDGETAEFEGFSVPCLSLEERYSEGALLAIFAYLALAPFGIR